MESRRPGKPAAGASWSSTALSACLPLSPGMVCLVCFLSAICFTLQSGNYWLEIFDSFAASLNLIIFAFMEVVGVVYVYGMKR